MSSVAQAFRHHIVERRFGDLNYRIDLPREDVLHMVKLAGVLEKGYGELADYDQLNRMRVCTL